MYILNLNFEFIPLKQIYERNKDNPAIARNMPPVSGKINWARQLLHRLFVPMEIFKVRVIFIF